LQRLDTTVFKLWQFKSILIMEVLAITYLISLQASSRFGTPEELKLLIDTAHGLGIAVIMDIVHSHAAKNEIEGLGNFAGDPYQYFYQGSKREHPAWDSLCFDYGKNEVIHFLLSNCKFWMDEYKFDGFRFDGVTSMLYYSHGLGEALLAMAIISMAIRMTMLYVTLLWQTSLYIRLILRPITIAEEVSGMPGLAAKTEDGGYGFDYRMAMNIPDYWIKTIKEKIRRGLETFIYILGSNQSS